MRYVSLFSGIEAASAAWAGLGWECVAVAEIEPFPCEVLRQRHPGVPNLGDITKITEEQIMMLGHVDLVVFGSPCQDLSVAGKRKGLDGQRSGLFFDAMRIIQWLRNWNELRWALWENVPGAFSSNKGADFAVVVGQMAGVEQPELPPKGWGTEGAIVGSEAMVEWSVLDAQWFGVAQRRRRVFALADFGNWDDRPPLLLEPQGMRGDSAPRREKGQDVTHDLAPCLTSSGRGVARSGDTRGQDGVVACLDASYARLQGASGQDANHGHSHLVPVGLQRPVLAFGGNNQTGTIDVATARNACSSSSGRLDFESETFIVCEDVSPIIAFNSNAQPDEMKFDPELSAPLTCSQNSTVAYSVALRGREGGANAELGDSVGHCLRASGGGGDKPHVLYDMRVRRLTPRECERLQAFPDDHTLITFRGKPAADGPRYKSLGKSLGNSMCVNVMRWIGQQIDFVHNFH